MNNEIKDTLTQVILENYLPLRLLENWEDWDKVYKNIEYIPVSFTRAIIDYQKEYMKSFYEYVDIPIVIYHHNQTIGIWALCLKKDTDGKWVLGSNGTNVVPPLLTKGLSKKVKKNIINHCMEFINKLAKKLDIYYWCGSHLIYGNVDAWYRKTMENSATITETNHLLFTDLSLDIKEIKSNVRKSYKALISKGRSLWKVNLYHNEIDNIIFEEFLNFHYYVSGKVTRPINTWNIQKSAIRNGDAFLITLRDEGLQMVGGGLFYISRDEGAYAVGVYDRDLFDLPLGHLVQMTAIEYMKKLNLKWYRIGERPYSSQSNIYSEKEINIGYFKEGFASHIFLSILTKSNTLCK